jgi:hypothetical protein
MKYKNLTLKYALVNASFMFMICATVGYAYNFLSQSGIADGTVGILITAVSLCGLVGQTLSGSIIDKSEKIDEKKFISMALIAVMLLQIILLRAMYASQFGDYKILSNIGLTCRLAVDSVWRQLFTQALVGQLLGALAIWICAQCRVERILNILIYLPIGYVVMLLALHIAVSMVATAWVLKNLRTQIYPLAGLETDLDMDKEAEA